MLQRASAAGAVFVACADQVTKLPGYVHRDGPEGRGYYRVLEQCAPPPPPIMTTTQSERPAAFDDFLSTMKALGAV